MAPISKGVVERANTIEENRKVLSELMRKNEFVEPSQEELNELFTRLNAENARELLKDMKSLTPVWHGKKVTDRLYGPVPGIPSGSWWGIRMDCSRDRVHDPFIASVQCGPVGAVSVYTSHSNEDVDFGDILTFTGSQDTDEDKEENEANKSLILNLENVVPLRIIRGCNLSNEYSPKTGVRYDGLYMVAHYWIGISPRSGTRCHKFALKRLFHQEPPPWKSNKPSARLASVPAFKCYSKNCNPLDQARVTSGLDDADINNRIMSPSISTKKYQTRDQKTSKIVKSARKRRRRSDEESLELEPCGRSSSLQAAAVTSILPQILPARKIVSTIVTRRVSKKLQHNNLDNKLMPDGGVNKSWNLVAGSEPQIFGSCNEGEEEVVKSQSTRLQNTNISIRTDLYDSSHNLKQYGKKCSSTSTHGTGIFKPRVLGAPRRELHFAGVDSSPGSSRTVCSVKMERVTSVAAELRREERKNEDKTEFCEPKGAGSLLKAPESKKVNEQSLDGSSTFNSPSQSPAFMGFECSGKSRSGVECLWAESSMLMNSLTLDKMLDIITEEKSSPMAKMLISNVIGFPTDGSFSDFDKATRAQLHTLKSLAPLETVAELHNESTPQNPDPRTTSNKLSINEKRPSTMRTRSRDQLVILKPGNETHSSLADHKKLEASNSRHTWHLENSKRQNIIEIVYASEEPDLSQESVDCSSGTQKIQSTAAAKTNEGDKDVSLFKVVTKTPELAENSNKSDKNITSNEPYSSTRQSRPMEDRSSTCAVMKYKNDHESRREEEGSRKTEMKVIRRSCDNSKGDRVLSTYDEDTIDSCSSKPTKSVFESQNSETQSQLAMMTGKRGLNNYTEDAAILGKQNYQELLEPEPLSLSEPSASQTTITVSKSQPPSAAQIITRSRCLQNSTRSTGDTNSEALGHQVGMNLRLNNAHSGVPDLNKSLKNLGERITGEKIVPDSAAVFRLRSTDKGRLSEVKLSKNIATVLKSGNYLKDEIPNQENTKPECDKGDTVSNEKRSENMRLVKRSRVRVKRKMEIANLVIDMNMSPRCQMSKSKSRRSLRGENHSRRRSCPAVVDRGMKRRNDDSVKHPTSPLKRLKKSVQMQTRNVATTKKGLSLRKRTKNHASPSNNNNNNNTNKNNNNNHDNNSMKRIGTAEKVINKIKNRVISGVQNLVTNKNTVNRLKRAAAEIPKRHETMARTRSGRSLTVGRLGLRRALLSGTETYVRKKKKKKEKQRPIAEKLEKQKPLGIKQPLPKKELVEFALNKAKLGYNVSKGTGEAKKPKMVSVMTQCSLISDPPQYSTSLVATYQNEAIHESNLCTKSGYLHSSDSGSECVCSSHNSGLDQIKNEIIELIEIKSETIDDDVAFCDDEDNEVRENPNSMFNHASIRLMNHQLNQALDRANVVGPGVQHKSCTPTVRRLSRSLGAFNDQSPSDSGPKKGFIRYVAGRRTSVIAPVRTVEGSLRIAQLKSIGFKPIKPGVFPPDGFEGDSEYGRRSTSDSPRITYSSAVVKRGVHEEYDKYTSEENNVVQYMDSKLCYEDIENEDVLFGRSSMFVGNIEFRKPGSEIMEESNDTSVLQGGSGDEDDEDEAEELRKEDIKEWQSQMDANSSYSEDTEQAVADSDGDVPWHGWRKIISNKETYFVGW